MKAQRIKVPGGGMLRLSPSGDLAELTLDDEADSIDLRSCVVLDRGAGSDLRDLLNEWLRSDQPVGPCNCGEVSVIGGRVMTKSGLHMRDFCGAPISKPAR